MIVACCVSMASSSARPWSVAVLSIEPACCKALLNGVMCSASRACISVVVLVRLAITIEMPIELPMLRTSVSIAVPLLRSSPGSVANATVDSGTNTRPRPAPWMMPVTTMVRVEVSVVKPTIW